MATTTPERGYQLPAKATKLKDDVLRLITTFGMIDADVAALLLALADKADATHGHGMGDIAGLAAALANKLDNSHHDALGDLNDVDVTGVASGMALLRQAGLWIPVALQVNNVSGLEAALNAKATPADITSAVNALVAAAPGALDTLNELATALGNDPAFATTITTALGRRVRTDAAQSLPAAEQATARANIGLDKTGLLIKADPRAVAFTKTGAGTASIKAGTIIEVAGAIYTFVAATAIAMPTLAAGTDYAIWIKPDGTLAATTDHVSPPVASSRKIGGFHYAPGGNATAVAGGDTTPAINEYSLWDLHFRPACPDPRGMALVAGSFWVDIYLLGVNHHTDGTSRYNVTIADGSSPPKVPTAFGGNGSTAYGSLNWWEAAEVMQSHGKELLDVAEFGAAMYGTTEATSGTTDPVSTIMRAAFTSKWGVMLATGNLWVWGRDFGGSYGTAAYTANGRGSTYMLSNAALLGGGWGHAAVSGSRASYWSNLPSNSSGNFGARGRCDHLCHV